MGLQFKLQTPEATYFLDAYGSVTGVGECLHFAIDCACSGKNGSHYKNAGKGTTETFGRYAPFYGRTPQQHTFYMNQQILEVLLDDWHNEEQKDKPLIIVCNTCSKEFPFTHQSYRLLEQRIRDDGEQREIPD